MGRKGEKWTEGFSHQALLLAWGLLHNCLQGGGEGKRGEGRRELPKRDKTLTRGLARKWTNNPGGTKYKHQREE